GCAARDGLSRAAVSVQYRGGSCQHAARERTRRVEQEYTHVGAVLGGPWFAVGVRPGPGEEPQLVTAVRRDSELPRLRNRAVGQRGVPLAFRSDVLPRTAW